MPPVQYSISFPAIAIDSSINPASRAELPDSRAAQILPFALLLLAFIFAGLTGHDPWKADEAYIFGVVQHMLETSDWVVPQLAGEPFMEKPPLFYWVASTCAGFFSGWLPLHDGARLACGLFMLLTCWALARATRIWCGAGSGRYAPLLLIACFGTLVQSHMMMPDIPLLAGFAVSALGFANIPGNPRKGGILLGLGIGIGFLSKGVLAPGVMGVTALVLPLCFRQWRSSAYWRALRLAAAVSAPACLIWPLALYLRSPDLFMEWFWVNNVGRFLGFSVPQLGAEHLPWFWSQTLPWFTFPALPLALWGWWSQRKNALAQPGVQYALVSFAVLMLVLAVSKSGRCVYAWPLLLPISILAARGVQSLPRHVEQCWRAAGLGLFGFLSLCIWSGWGIMMLKGAPPDWPRLLRLLPAEFIPRFDASRLLAALLFSLGALFLLRAVWHQPARALSIWVTGITLSWALLTTLWMPWLDFAKSYRPVFAALPIPDSTNCIASISLGEGERAMLRYVTGINPVRVEVAPNAGCTTLLVQREAAFGEPEINFAQWKELWRGSRPGVTNERFWLFRRVDSGITRQGRRELDISGLGGLESGF